MYLLALCCLLAAFGERCSGRSAEGVAVPEDGAVRRPATALSGFLLFQIL
jgi:hypothetical protein